MFYFFNELTDELTVSECLVYSFIHAIYYRTLSGGEERYFSASNSYIASQLGLSSRTVITLISKLEKKGYLEVIRSVDENDVPERFIIPKLIDLNRCFNTEKKQAKLCSKNIGGEKNFHGGSEETSEGVVKKLQHNNINNININNNNINKLLTPQENISKKSFNALDHIDELEIPKCWNEERIKDGLRRWVEFKTNDRREPYKSLAGLKSLLTTLERSEPSTDLVLYAIDVAISRNWAGVQLYPNIIETFKGNEKPLTEQEKSLKVIEEFQRNYKNNE